MPEIRLLRLPDLEHLRLRRHFRLEIEDIRQLLETNPDSSFWIPDTDEVILVGNWRNRSDLHAIHGLAAGRNESALIELAIEQARRMSVAAVMMVDADELRSSSFYARHGFTIIDRIATYELPASRLGPEDTAGSGGTSERSSMPTLPCPTSRSGSEHWTEGLSPTSGSRIIAAGGTSIASQRIPRSSGPVSVRPLWNWRSGSCGFTARSASP
jgi:hypothetical protein